MVGLASSQGMIRAANASGSSHRLRDHDLIANILTPVNFAGAALRIPCNPRFWPNTRAYQESLGFQCYNPRAITVHWRPAVGATTAGQVVGGSLAYDQQVGMLLVANALMASPGSQAGPVWKDMDFKMDLSVLTQLKYQLNDETDSGVPCAIYVILPSSAVGMIEISYDIEMYGQSTAPVNIPLYDIIPRSWTSPANTSTAIGTLSPSTGLVGGNEYMVTFACAPAIATNIQLTQVIGGGGPVAIDTSFFNSTVSGYTNVADLLGFTEDAQLTYLNSTLMENLVTYVWLSGPPN